uniref:Transmembrane protein n=1 Tax=Parastrongyloides trichosuri TaxID=131310 RepID=A0A0N4ZR66_PARTI
MSQIEKSFEVFTAVAKNKKEKDTKKKHQEIREVYKKLRIIRQQRENALIKEKIRLLKQPESVLTHFTTASASVDNPDKESDIERGDDFDRKKNKSKTSEESYEYPEKQNFREKITQFFLNIFKPYHGVRHLLFYSMVLQLLGFVTALTRIVLENANKNYVMDYEEYKYQLNAVSQITNSLFIVNFIELSFLGFFIIFYKRALFGPWLIFILFFATGWVSLLIVCYGMIIYVFRRRLYFVPTFLRVVNGAIFLLHIIFIYLAILKSANEKKLIIKEEVADYINMKRKEKLPKNLKEYLEHTITRKEDCLALLKNSENNNEKEKEQMKKEKEEKNKVIFNKLREYKRKQAQNQNDYLKLDILRGSEDIKDVKEFIKFGNSQEAIDEELTAKE